MAWELKVHLRQPSNGNVTVTDVIRVVNKITRGHSRRARHLR